MSEENPFFEITKAIRDAVDNENSNSLSIIDDFRQEVLRLMLDSTPISWTQGLEISFTSEVVSGRDNESCDVVASEMFDAGFDLAHIVGAKFVIRPITGRVFPESWDG